LDGGIVLCKGCHYRLHHTDSSLSAEIVKKRGQKWYNNLRKKALNRPVGSYMTLKWYQDTIKRLNEYLEK